MVMKRPVMKNRALGALKSCLALCPLSAGLLLTGLLLTGCGAEPEPLRDVSVVLVSPDSLRADRLRPWNDAAPISVPNLERLAARGSVYLNAWSTSPWTAPSMVSIMTGLYPPSHGVAYRDDTTPTSLPTLPRMLAARGYEIGNFSFFSQISYFRNLGLGEAERGLRHARVAESFGRWLGRLEADQQFFAWVHLLEPHLPYGATGYRAKEASIDGSTGLVESQVNAVVPIGTVEFAPGDRELLLELYDRDVAKMDEAVGKVIAALEEHGRLDNTVVIFAADHGEELLDDGWVGHASTAIEAKLIPEIMHVPLILAGPGIAAETHREIVQQTDILPTIIQLLGLEDPGISDGYLLPGFAAGWRSWWQGQRELAFFDSSPGGNLTPQERRGERLQGLTDGRCLITTRVGPDVAEEIRVMAADGDAECGDGDTRRLRDALEDWQQDQTEQRLALLARHGGGSGPPSEEIDGYTEAIEVVHPSPGERLSWDSSGGQVVFEWTGGAPVTKDMSYWIEYRLGSPPLEIQGSFQVAQQRVMFGPVPHGFWNDVAIYSPSRIRIADDQNQQRSPWIEFEVLPVE